MTRPRKSTVDYFPHSVQHGKTMFILETKWGNDGYATWFKILEHLGSSENHVINLNDEAESVYLAACCKITQETLFAILDQCSAVNAIQPDFWRKKLVYSPNFVQNIADAYRKRREKLLSEQELMKLYNQYFPEEIPISDGFPAEETPISGINPAEETHKGKGKGKGKVNRNNKKEIDKEKNLTLLPPDFQISDRVRKWAAEQKRNHLEDHLESFKLKCQAKKYKYANWDAAFMNAIRDNWARMGDQNGSSNNGGTGKAFEKTGGARSDDELYPVDFVCNE